LPCVPRQYGVWHLEVIAWYNRCGERVAQRRFHYEQAFEHYLRANRVPYIAVDEARKSLLPVSRPRDAVAREVSACGGGDVCGGAIKSFDFVVYAPQRNLLVDVKGRMYGPPPRALRLRAGCRSSVSWGRRFESWVTMDDVEGMRRWQELFGREFEATFVFVYCLRKQPPDALFEEVFAWGPRWYALREVPLAEYEREMTPRSGKWRTVHIPADAFSRISRPFSARAGVCHPALAGPAVMGGPVGAFAGAFAGAGGLRRGERGTIVTPGAIRPCEERSRR
jgi:hypothetical protein